MRRHIILALLLVNILIISGCENVVDVSKISDKDLDRLSSKLIVCEKPYIRYGGSCCLDKNENKICDRDERELTEDEKKGERETERPIEKMPEEIPKEEVIKQPTEPKEEMNRYPHPKNIDLSNFPYIFIKDKKFEGFIVVGDKAPAESVIGASDIAMALQYVNEGVTGVERTTIQKIDVGETKVNSEIADLTEQNIILVGFSDCVGEGNSLLQELLGTTSDCKGYFEEGKGIIELFDTGKGNVALVVAGYTPTDIRIATSILANYDDYALKGKKCTIVTSTLTIDCK